MRSVHSLSGLIIGLLVSVVAFTGAYLSVEPMLERIPVATSHGISVAEITHMANQKVTGIERIERKASGAVLIHGLSQNEVSTSVLNTKTGEVTPQTPRSVTMSFMNELHRSIFLGDFGRIIAGISAICLLFISYSGLVMLAKRMGGWTKIFSSARGTKSQRLHIDIARVTMAGFTLSAITGLYMSMVTFAVLPDASTETLPFPEEVAIGSPISPADMSALLSVPLSNLRELTFPYPDDPTDVFTIKTASGAGFIDQVTGEIIAFSENGRAQKTYEKIYMLHTGQGGGLTSALFAIILGLSALAIPVLSFTGIIIWLKRRRSGGRIEQNSDLETADTIILVGSEGNATWGFASTLHKALTEQGKKVRTEAMNSISQDHLDVAHVFILTSTYGDGIAPSSADQFEAKLRALELNPLTKFNVLGFGDKQFTDFCAFANKVEILLRKKQANFLDPLSKINQQSSQSFKDWGKTIGQKMGVNLDLEHVPRNIKTQQIALSKIVARSQENDAPTAILRFALRQELLSSKMKTFEAGDLIGVIPPISSVPRYYSIASSSDDGFIEICVKLHKCGLCSNYLLNLEEGELINFFLKENLRFKPDQTDAPIVMIGAGTGIAPLAGIARQNTEQRPTYLFWGGRNPHTDFIYKDTLVDLMNRNRLSKIFLAFSRFANRLYVQDRLKLEAELLKSLVAQGAQIMVCGGPEMANSVRETINSILVPQGETITSLQLQNRYLEDVY
ncbi:PepSY domain-containing protein [Lentilitoribacter sp. Alg239-R112]|uniref:PepSY domain-containing protein n=1 Tax=Lentilitoribacter sp. Alg239-R112 TaxID=2305987 RepID=UPI0013A6FB5D|nr:PepSY domain-containing protein [Lentilitoribacter sp. Alg239-R112]